MAEGIDSVGTAGVGWWSMVEGEVGLDGVNKTLLRFPAPSNSVGRSSRVTHLPSTINLYGTFSSHGTRILCAKPDVLFGRRIERDHY